MTPVTKAQWAEALRSGEYAQVSGSLVQRHPNGEIKGFCCLGVLASLAGFEVVAGDHGSCFDFDGNIEPGIIPEKLRPTIVSDLSLNDEVPRRRSGGDDLMRQLSCMNDRGSSFEEIALYLEKLE